MRCTQRGVRCMISVAPDGRLLPEAEKRKEGYRTEIAKIRDIIETDYPLEPIGLYLIRDASTNVVLLLKTARIRANPGGFY